MSRLPFDPDRMRTTSRGGGTGEEALSVSRLAAMIENALASALPSRVTVAGEIGQCRRRTHWYFDLKDAESVISCVMWASDARSLRFEPATGMQVVARGQVRFYPAQGRTQLYVQSMHPVGEGDLDRRLRELVEECRALGWLDPERKRPLPALPRAIGVVTSRTGAALQDVLDTVRRRCPAVGLVVADTRVQGEGASNEVVRAIGRLGAQHAALGVDAIIVTRGGGSLEDLWAFNEKEVAHAIVRCPVPVVAAIGHETDTTLAELVADERCATPTQAAMRLTPETEALIEQLAQVERAMRVGIRRRLADRRSYLDARAHRLGAEFRHAVMARRLRVDRAAHAIGAARPDLVILQRRQRVDRLSAAMARAIAGRVQRAGDRVESLRRELVAGGPRSVLARGYSVTLDARGRGVRSVRDVKPGQRLSTKVLDGTIESVVDGRPVRRAHATDADQMDLFLGSG